MRFRCRSDKSLPFFSLCYISENRYHQFHCFLFASRSLSPPLDPTFVFSLRDRKRVSDSDSTAFFAEAETRETHPFFNVVCGKYFRCFKKNMKKRKYFLRHFMAEDWMSELSAALPPTHIYNVANIVLEKSAPMAFISLGGVCDAPTPKRGRRKNMKAKNRGDVER